MNGPNQLVCVTNRPFKLSLIFASEAGAYLISASSCSRILALPTNIRLGWKSQAWMNVLAMDKLKLTGLYLGRVFNSKSDCFCYERYCKV
jgi:hypothetical protein